MTYFATRATANAFGLGAVPDNCMLCGGALGGPIIAYDSVSEIGVLWAHRDCAFAMANRIICDAWPNRRYGALMENDR